MSWLWKVFRLVRVFFRDAEGIPFEAINVWAWESYFGITGKHIFPQPGPTSWFCKLLWPANWEAHVHILFWRGVGGGGLRKIACFATIPRVGKPTTYLKADLPSSGSSLPSSRQVCFDVMRAQFAKSAPCVEAVAPRAPCCQPNSPSGPLKRQGTLYVISMPGYNPLQPRL